MHEILQIECLHLRKTVEKFWLVSIHMKCQINIWEVYLPMEANMQKARNERVQYRSGRPKVDQEVWLKRVWFQ